MINIGNVISFDRLKARYQKYKMDTAYYWYLLSCDIGIFEYENLPESIDATYIELYLLTTGSCGIKKMKDGTFMVGTISRDGDLNQYGLGEDCFICTLNGEDDTGTLETPAKNGVDSIIIYNNPLKTPELDIMQDAVAMSDCQQSAGINVKFARIAPAWRIRNSTQANALDEMFNGILDGNLKTFVDEANIAQDDIAGIVGGDRRMIEPVDITQPERIQYVQYLSRYQDDIARRHFSRRGLAMRTPTKAAQQSDSEINGMDSVSWFYVLQKMKEREKGWNAFNALYQENVRVKLSPIWENEYNAYIIRALKKDEETETEMQTERNDEYADNGQDAPNGNTDT